MTTNNSTNILNVTSGSSLYYQKILALTASNSATLEFTGLTNAYSDYFFTLQGLAPVSNNLSLYALMGPSGYAATVNFMSRTLTAGGTAANVCGSNQAQITLASNVYAGGDAINWAPRGRGWLSGMGSSVDDDPCFRWDLAHYNNADRIWTSGMAPGYSSGLGAWDRIKFYFSTGNIASGTVTMYGILA